MSDIDAWLFGDTSAPAKEPPAKIAEKPQEVRAPEVDLGEYERSVVGMWSNIPFTFSDIDALRRKYPRFYVPGKFSPEF